jgi:hypothetical protein
MEENFERGDEQNLTPRLSDVSLHDTRTAGGEGN